MAIKKSAGGVEDLTFGMGTEPQMRAGRQVDITQINADKIPYSSTQSTKAKIDQVDSKVEAVRNAVDKKLNIDGSNEMKGDLIISNKGLGLKKNGLPRLYISSQDSGSSIESFSVAGIALGQKIVFEDNGEVTFPSPPTFQQDPVRLDHGVRLAYLSTNYVSKTGDAVIDGELYALGGLRSNTYIETGRGSGSVAMTYNDGYGNANLCFNHRDGIPDQNGTSGRITVETDNIDGRMRFQIGNSIKGTPLILEDKLILHSGEYGQYKGFLAFVSNQEPGVQIYNNHDTGSGDYKWKIFSSQDNNFGLKVVKDDTQTTNFITISKAGNIQFLNGTSFTYNGHNIYHEGNPPSVVGEIKLYSGDVANLEAGWYVCDGTNGTPDMSADFKTYGSDNVVYIQYRG